MASWSRKWWINLGWFGFVLNLRVTWIHQQWQQTRWVGRKPSGTVRTAFNSSTSFPVARQLDVLCWPKKLKSNSGLVIQFNLLTLSHRAWCHLFFLGRRKVSPMLKCCWTIIWITWRCVVPDVPRNQLFDFVSSKKKIKCIKWFCSLWTTSGSCIRWNGGNICHDQTFRQYQSVTWTEWFDGWSWNLRRSTSFIWSGFTSMSSWGSLEEQRQVLERQEKNTWWWIMV